MDTVTIRFTSHWPYNPTSPIIACLAGSRQWSHSMAIIGDTAYEASMLHACRVVPVAQAMQGVAVYQDMTVPAPDLAASIQFGRDQDGKAYDFAGAVGLPLLSSQNWADDTKWWCSEHTFMLLLKGGTTLLDPNVAKRITPEHLSMCNYPKSPIVRL